VVSTSWSGRSRPGCSRSGSLRRRAPWRRALAARTLGQVGADEAAPALVELLSDHSRYVREGLGRYRRRDLILIGGWALLEAFWYQPLSAAWRPWAGFLWLIGRRPDWGTIPRRAALAQAPAEAPPELAPAPLTR
jgi:hypothetical protein